MGGIFQHCQPPSLSPSCVNFPSPYPSVKNLFVDPPVPLLGPFVFCWAVPETPARSSSLVLCSMVFPQECAPPGSWHSWVPLRHPGSARLSPPQSTLSVCPPGHSVLVSGLFFLHFDLEIIFDLVGWLAWSRESS